ncbi:MAG: PIG-L family deacetylase, partial [Thermoanaerobaculia bacterium]
GGLLAQLSRGRGARVSLLTLNRGESGDNAIGPELFDAVGLIRTEELRVAGRYYGLDRQYFTTMTDYGFSKRLEEALTKWGRENVLREVVRIIRMDRPFVLIARFQGNRRDGHGNHEAAGLITQQAFRAAGDPARFPEQIRDGLRPWQPMKLYMGGVREDEDWTVRVDTGEYSPWLGESYQSFSRIGLAFQRSQNGGRVGSQAGSSIAYYKRLASVLDAVRLKPDTTGTTAPGTTAPRTIAPSVVSGFSRTKENSFFDGIDTSIPGIFNALHRQAPPAAAALLSAIDVEVRAAIEAFSMQHPSAVVPALARGLRATVTAIARLSDEPDAVFILKVKEQQFQDAINAALGIDFQAIASVPGPLVPGQRVSVDLSLTNHGLVSIDDLTFALVAPTDWKPLELTISDARLRQNESERHALTLTVPDDAPLT